MFSKEEILAELARGRSLEQIAQEAANALNEAKSQYERQKAEEEIKRRREEENRKKVALQKEAKVKSIFGNIFDYMSEFYPEVFNETDFNDFFREFEASKFVEAVDKTIDEIKSLPVVKKNVEQTPHGWKVKLEGEDAKKANDAIQKFLRENNLF